MYVCHTVVPHLVSSRSISADLPISYCFHVKVGSAIGRQVSPIIPEVSRRCDVIPEVETVLNERSLEMCKDGMSSFVCNRKVHTF